MANYIVLTLFGLAAVLPFVYVIAGSFASDAELTSRAVFFIPKTFTLNAYEFIFSTDTIVKSIGVSVYVTVVGTLVNLFFTVTMAYSLAKRGLYGRNLVLNLVIFSMLFGGGMIPTYLVVKELHLLDSLWALMLPGAISAFNLIIVKNFFQEIPKEIEEAKPHRRLLRAWPLVADRAAAVDARPRHVYAVLRRRALERFFFGAALY